MMPVAKACAERGLPFEAARSLLVALLMLWASSGSARAFGLGQSPPPSGDPASPQAPAAASPVEARLGLEAGAGRILIGQPISLTLWITHPAGLAVIPARLPARWGDLEVVEQSPPQSERLPAGLLQSRQRIAVRPWVTGTLETAAMTLTLVEGASRSSLSVTPARFSVDSVLPPGQTLPRDIRAQAEIPAPPRWPVLLVGLALGAGLIALLKRRPRPALPAPPPPAPDLRTAAEIALAVLDRIDAEGLLAAARILEHYDRVSDCLRAYIEAEFGLPALDRTSRETLRALQSQGLPAAQGSRLGRFLADADLVKFARLEPEGSVAAAFSQRARELIPSLESARRSQRVLDAMRFAAPAPAASPAPTGSPASAESPGAAPSPPDAGGVR